MLNEKYKDILNKDKALNDKMKVGGGMRFDLQTLRKGMVSHQSKILSYIDPTFQNK